MGKLRKLLNLAGIWLGPALLVLAMYLLIVPIGPFSDLWVFAAIGGVAVGALAVVLMRSPRGRRQRGLLALVTLAAAAFFGWRHYQDRQGYREEVLSFDNRGAHLVGTLYLPDRVGKVPGIVWVHGSGGNPRSSLASTAAHFARSGYAVLVYDKRGVGESTGRFDEMNATTPDNIDLLASDAAAALSLLAARAEVRPEATGFVGVSQAGWIAPRAAVLNGKAAFMLLMSGPVTSTHAFLRYERFHIGAFDEPTIMLARKAMGQGDIPNGMTADAAYDLAQQQVRLDLPYPDYDPVADLRKLNIPGLWLMAGRDWMVPPGPSVRKLDMLRTEGKPYAYRYISGASHGMHLGPKEPVLNAIDTWLAQVTKPAP